LIEADFREIGENMYKFNTPLRQITLYNKKIYIKDESFCPTGTFKDRLAIQLIDLASKWTQKKILLSCITMGNTLLSIKWVVEEFLKHKNITICGLFPKNFGNRLLGPNSRGKFEYGNYYYSKLNSKKVFCTEVDLSKYLEISEIRLICEELTSERFDLHIDLSYGLENSGYVEILKECLDAKNDWDYILVPFGAGILFEDIYKEIDNRDYKTSVIGATTNREMSIADKLYSFYSRYFKELNNDGLIEVGKYNRHKVHVISDDEIVDAINNIKGIVHSEPSAAAAFSLINKINCKSANILVINTGEGF